MTPEAQQLINEGRALAQALREEINPDSHYARIVEGLTNALEAALTEQEQSAPNPASAYPD